MARKKVIAETLVAGPADADRVLEELADLSRRATAVKCAMNERIDAVKAEAKLEIDEIESRQKVLEAALGSFAVMNRAVYFQDRKSLELTFGTLAFRLSHRIVTAGRGVTWDQVLGRLKELGHLDGIRLKEEVDKEALAGWDDAKLERVGAKRKTEDNFGYTLKQQDVVLGHQAAN